VSEPSVRVLVVDDDGHVRAALREIIDDQLDLRWIGDAVDAGSAVAACVRHQPDVAVVDVRIPGGGVAATRAVRARCPEVAIVAHSAFSGRPHRELMLAAGATSYVTKGSPGDQLLDAIRQAARRRGSQG
jgi:DNA-binding NarL/FixJ family response regulator